MTDQPPAEAGSVTRRAVLKAGLAAGAWVAAAPAVHAQTETRLVMSSWGAKAEIDGFNDVIAKYQASHPGVTIKLEVTPSANYYQVLDTRFAGGQAPDLFRCQYQKIGPYAHAGAAIDLSRYLEPGYGEQFVPTFWSAASFDGKVHALPHHTDTFALYYNVDHLAKVGIEPPAALDKSWSWGEFIQAAEALKKAGTAPYPFAMGWQFSNAYRWLVYLYQHGGRMLDDDGRTPLINTKAGIETIAWTQSWFTKGLVPPNTSLKSTEATQNLFANGTISMLLNGNWQIPFLAEQMTKWKWAVTYMPRDVAMASDLGGNCVAVSKDSKKPEVAADFLKFLVDEANMRSFITTGMFLPVRKSLMAENLAYPTRPELMTVFKEQAKTIPADMAKTEVLPKWKDVNQKMADQLDLAFTSGQSPEDTARKIEASMRTILV